MVWEFIYGVYFGGTLDNLIFIFFLFTFAANLGSFLNVLVYRIPLKRSVVFGCSACPCCNQIIRFRDNVPVLGWFLLQGRCRDCLVPIPIRYPVVEGFAAIVLGSVASCELLSGGANLPLDNNVATHFLWRGADGLLLQPNARLFLLCAIHVCCLAILITWALIEWDQNRVPIFWWAVPLLGLLCFIVYFPWLQPVGLGPNMKKLIFAEGISWTHWKASGLVSLCGLVFGWGIGFSLKSLSRVGSYGPQGLALVGTLCGWSAVCVVSCLWAIIASMRHALVKISWVGQIETRNDQLPPLLLIDLVIATAIFMVCWQWLDCCIQSMTRFFLR